MRTERPVETTAPAPAARKFDLASVRADFPILERPINGHRLVYLDSVATAQKPRSVIAAEAHYYETMNANVHRSIHTLAAEATEAYEAARARVARFIGADDARGVLFNSGTTAGINLLASCWSAELKAGDEILLTEMEHHSNLVPWFLAAQRAGAVIKHIPVTDEGRLDLTALPEVVSARTRIVSLAHVSNVLGTVNPVAEIAAAVRKLAKGAVKIAVDAAQSAPHCMLDLRTLGADAVAFSAHKMLGPTGVGLLWVRPDLLEQMTPYQGGGEMIREVYLDRATWADIPARFEPGTPNIAGVAALPAALDYLESFDLPTVAKHEADVLDYAMEQLRALGGVRILGPADGRVGSLSFADKRVHPHDLATILDQRGVAIRAGHHCAQPLHRRFGLIASARASFYLYNGRDDVDALVDGLREARRYLG